MTSSRKTCCWAKMATLRCAVCVSFFVRYVACLALTFSWSCVVLHKATHKSAQHQQKSGADRHTLYLYVHGHTFCTRITHVMRITLYVRVDVATPSILLGRQRKERKTGPTQPDSTRPNPNQSKPNQYVPNQTIPKQSKTKQNKTKQNKTKQNVPKPN